MRGKVCFTVKDGHHGQISGEGEERPARSIPDSLSRFRAQPGKSVQVRALLSQIRTVPIFSELTRFASRPYGGQVCLSSPKNVYRLFARFLVQFCARAEGLVFADILKAGCSRLIRITELHVTLFYQIAFSRKINLQAIEAGPR
jgi:hypothetical protein